MRGGALPAALLCAAVGLALAYFPRRTIVSALGLLSGGAVAGSLLPASSFYTELAFLGCWTMIIVLAASVHLPGSLPSIAIILVSAVAGLCAGAVISAEGVPTDLVRALPFLILVVPAHWAVNQGWQIAIKVFLSWLAAVALLAALLPTTTTPGYVPDHMD